VNENFETQLDELGTSLAFLKRVVRVGDVHRHFGVAEFLGRYFFDDIRGMFHATMGYMDRRVGFSIEGTKAIVGIGELNMGERIREEDPKFENHFPHEWHGLFLIKETRTKNDICLIVYNGGNESGNVLRSVLSIRVKGDNDIGTDGLGEIVDANFEGSALATVDDLLEDFYAGFRGFLKSIIGASIINDENVFIVMGPKILND
jgi:hypothetical protein